MKLKNGFGLSPLLVLFILSTYGISSSGESYKGVPLFGEIVTQEELGNSDDPTIIRQRTANVNFKSLLNENITPETALNAADSIILNLFEDVRLTAVLDRLDATLPEFYSWIGHIAGVAQSKVILVVGNGLIKGSVTMPDAFYKISHVGNDTHVIYEIDQSRFPPESDSIPINSEEKVIAFDAISADSASTIDVMFFYTTAAREAAAPNDKKDDESYIRAEIIEALQDTNEGYLNSGVSHSIELIPFENYTPEIVEDESNFDWVDTLVGLRRPVDAYADHVHTLRDQHSADIVVLIAEGDGLSCGASYSMENLSSEFEKYAFSVVSRRCATISHSLGHELGHVMGSQHDHATAEKNDEVGVFDYSYGYQAPDQSFRTIMAYDCPDGCRRVNYWSNPDNEAYNGQPMGEANIADNTSSLNNTAFTVANFRISEQPDKTISGRVTDASAAGIQGVTITFSNGGGTTTTNSNGNYSRSVTYGWSGSATPAKSGYNFDPTSIPYANVTSNTSGQNFSGTLQTRSISGRVTDASAAGIQGVTITFSNGGGTTTTNSNGNYSRSVTYGWSGSATPAKSGYNFDPTSIPYANVTSNTSGQNFSGTLQTRSISGRVTDASAAGIQGVTITFSDGGGTTTTNSNGNYSRSVTYGWSGSATPAKSGYNFDPTSIPYANVTSNTSGQNFSGTLQTRSISGRVTDASAAGIQGVTITFSDGGGTTTTNSNGNYSRSVTYGWSGSATPAKSGYNFDPTSIPYANVTSNQSGKDFTGTAAGGSDPGSNSGDSEEEEESSDPDGNNSGTPDSQENNVVTVSTFDNQHQVTLATPAGTIISDYRASDKPDSENSPDSIDFSYGFFEFTVDGVEPGGATTVTLQFPAGTSFDTYYKYGPTPDKTSNHWYEFKYDGQTGAEINGNQIILHFVDGQRGDDDLVANGVVTDIGGPGVSATVVPSGDESQAADSSASGGSGGGGCFIGSIASGGLFGGSF
jgi:hypothetical protein